MRIETTPFSWCPLLSDPGYQTRNTANSSLRRATRRNLRKHPFFIDSKPSSALHTREKSPFTLFSRAGRRLALSNHTRIHVILDNSRRRRPQSHEFSSGPSACETSLHTDLLVLAQPGWNLVFAHRAGRDRSRRIHLRPRARAQTRPLHPSLLKSARPC